MAEAEPSHIALVDHSASTASPRESEPRPSTQDETSEIDILYENQRGFFFFGIPFYSQNALLGSFLRDLGPWVTAQFKPSPVDITNAQVPDPNWEWKWKTWYVDMSHDVDEEGWQYSLMFKKKSAWHGTHPWFHSFVRRRRWLRKRVKRKQKVEPKPELRGTSIGTSVLPSTFVNSTFKPMEEEILDGEVKDIPSLMNLLKKSAIDREKIEVIDEFVREGGEELHYLAEQIPTVLSTLMFQGSRKQLLEHLSEALDAAKKEHDDHKSRDQSDDDALERKIKNLTRALEVADEQVKRLEYWSDIKEITQNGETMASSDNSRGWNQAWVGVDASGAAAN